MDDRRVDRPVWNGRGVCRGDDSDTTQLLLVSSKILFISEEEGWGIKDVSIIERF